MHFNHFRRSMALLMGLLCLPAFAMAEQGPASIDDFLAGQGCTIGPPTFAAAVKAGFEPAEITKRLEKARIEEGTVVTGPWTVLSPEACRIRLPVIESEIRLTDPEVVKNTSARDAYAEFGELGCFIDGSIYQEVRKTRGWFSDKANLEYIRFLGQGLVSGELAFYSADILKTPVGPMITTGRCADVPKMPEIMRSHELLVEHFDTLVREYLKDDCEHGYEAMSRIGERLVKLQGEGRANAYTFYEIRMIAMAAGWFEGMSASSPGKLRPPMCHYK